MFYLITLHKRIIQSDRRNKKVHLVQLKDQKTLCGRDVSDEKLHKRDSIKECKICKCTFDSNRFKWVIQLN